MLTTPFDKISVSDICKSCGMNRKSFYYHFKDKFDLVNWVFYVDFLEKMDLEKYHSGWDAFRDICDLFYADKEFYSEALKIEGQNSFKDYIRETLYPLLKYYLSLLYEDTSTQEFFVNFFIDCFLAIILRWLSEGMQISSGEFVSEFKKMFVSLAKQIVRDEA